jgi:hypothetical protein
MTKENYKHNQRFSPGHGGMKCSCCTLGRPNELKKILNRSYRHKEKQKLKKEKENER